MTKKGLAYEIEVSSDAIAAGAKILVGDGVISADKLASVESAFRCILDEIGLIERLRDGHRIIESDLEEINLISRRALKKIELCFYDVIYLSE